MVSPPPSPLLPLSSQVGGHAGVLTTEDGSLIIKPALPLELEFYEKYSSHPSFEPLWPFLPKFFGTLKLEGTLDETKPESLTVKPLEGAEAVQKDEFSLRFPNLFLFLSRLWSLQNLVLENLTHSFSKPNILDIKLGTVLYDESAPADKRARMEKTARETTSGEVGIRLTGFQVRTRFLLITWLLNVPASRSMIIVLLSRCLRPKNMGNGSKCQTCQME